MTKSELTPVQSFNGRWCKRDDLAEFVGHEWPSGLKVRQYKQMALAQPGVPMIVGCSADSAMSVYVSAAAHQMGVPGIVYTAKRATRTAAVEYALNLGCEVIEVAPGYLSQIKAAAKQRAAELGRVVKWEPLLAIHDVAAQCANIPPKVNRVVVPVGTGLVAVGILLGLARRGLTIPVLGVAVSGMCDAGSVVEKASKLTSRPLPKYTQVSHPSKYHVPVAECLPCGFPLDPFYAAKAKGHVGEGELLWVSGLRAVPAFPKEVRKKLKL